MQSHYVSVALWFLTGAVITAVFSGSLVVPAKHAGFIEVMAIGMLVPSFTWTVQLTASVLAMPADKRRLYWGDLGRTCVVGSVALLPAAIANLIMADPPVWISAANVLASVAVMFANLLRRTARHGISAGWPTSFLATICLNMSLFVWSSWHWW